MSKGGSDIAQDPSPTGVEEEQISSAQESVPLPIFNGERKISVKWISRIYKQYSKEAPVSRPGKKG